MGSDTYGLLKTLMAPTKLSTKPFADFVKILGDHLDPQTTEMGERFLFGRRHQHDGGATFVAEPTQKKLVKVKDLSLETVIETAKISKAVDKCCSVVTGFGRSSSIGEISTP